MTVYQIKMQKSAVPVLYNIEIIREIASSVLITYIITRSVKQHMPENDIVNRN